MRQRTTRAPSGQAAPLDQLFAEAPGLSQVRRQDANMGNSHSGYIPDLRLTYPQ